MKKSTAAGICTTFLLFGLLSFILAFLAEGENIKVSSNNRACEKYKMKAFKIGIASTTAVLCTQLYAAYIFAGCCQCKEIGLDVNINVRLFYILSWIVAMTDFGLLMNTSLKVKYRLEDKAPGQNLCSAIIPNSRQNKFDVVKPFPILGLISFVVALMNIISFVLIYMWTKDPIPEKNTLLNAVPNMWYIDVEKEKLFVQREQTDMAIERDGETLIVRRSRLVVYWEKTVERLVKGTDNVQGQIAGPASSLPLPPPSPPRSRGRTTMKRWVHSTILLLVCLASSTLAFLAEVKNIKHSYLHGDCIEMKTAAYQLGFASAGLLVFALVHYFSVVICGTLRHYNACAHFLFVVAFVLSVTVIIMTAFTAISIKTRIDEHQPVKDICPVRKAPTLRVRFGFALDGVLILVVLILELITYNYIQVRPAP